jgi:hypothetical protein
MRRAWKCSALPGTSSYPKDRLRVSGELRCRRSVTTVRVSRP